MSWRDPRFILREGGSLHHGDVSERLSDRSKRNVGGPALRFGRERPEIAPVVQRIIETRETLTPETWDAIDQRIIDLAIETVLRITEGGADE